MVLFKDIFYSLDVIADFRFKDVTDIDEPGWDSEKEFTEEIEQLSHLWPELRSPDMYLRLEVYERHIIYDG